MRYALKCQCRTIVRGHVFRGKKYEQLFKLSGDTQKKKYQLNGGSKWIAKF